MTRAVVFTRWLALCGLAIGGLDLAVGAPWFFAAYWLAAAAVFGALSAWIRRSPAAPKEGIDA